MWQYDKISTVVHITMTMWTLVTAELGNKPNYFSFLALLFIFFDMKNGQVLCLLGFLRTYHFSTTNSSLVAKISSLCSYEPNVLLISPSRRWISWSPVTFSSLDWLPYVSGTQMSLWDLLSPAIGGLPSFLPYILASLSPEFFFLVTP